MKDDNLTADQRALVYGDADSFVQACPGAGKTRAIVRRYLRRTSEEPRKGVALVSFTKVAIEEVRERCGAHREALEPPHFVGTIDGFINRFFTTPLYARRYGRPLSYVESWDSLPSSSIPAREHKLNLEWFEFDASGAATFRSERVQDTYASALVQRVQQSLGYFCNQASQRRRSLFEDNGIASSSASRWFARTQLADPVVRALMVQHIGSRFAEVIVDEAQDCGADELVILKFLQEAGMAVSLVADRDQAIFEFRRATPQQLDIFVESLKPGQPLIGNFRSSPAICALNNSLRHGPEADNPVGRNADVTTPIQLVQYKELKELLPLLRTVATEHGIAEQDLVVLAHRRTHACKAAGSVAASDVGTGKLVLIADASQLLRAQGADPRSRVRAVERVERVLLDRVEADLPAYATLDTICESLGIERRWLREAAVRTMMAANPAECDRTQYSARVQTTVEGLAFPSNLSVRSVTQYLRTPTADQWAKLDTAPQAACLRWATVHSVKGQEFGAVALVIPDRKSKGEDGLTGVDHWKAGTDAESRRVLYVGASRAEKLLILAVHSQQYSNVKTILEHDSVPFDVVAAN